MADEKKSGLNDFSLKPSMVASLAGSKVIRAEERKDAQPQGKTIAYTAKKPRRSLKDRANAYANSFAENEKKHQADVKKRRKSKRKSAKKVGGKVNMKALTKAAAEAIKPKGTKESRDFIKEVHNQKCNLPAEEIAKKMYKYLEECEVMKVQKERKTKKEIGYEWNMSQNKLLDKKDKFGGSGLYEAWCWALELEIDKITELNLNVCHVNDDFIKELAPRLKKMSNLKVLQLESNDIRDEGFTLLAGALEALPGLTVFRAVNQERITPTTALEKLFDAAKEHKSLIKMSIKWRETYHRDKIDKMIRANQDAARKERVRLKKLAKAKAEEEARKNAEG